MLMQLIRKISSPDSQNIGLSIGGEFIQRHQEPLHFLMAGSTGTGKSTAIVEMMSGIAKRGDRMIVCDPGGFYLSRFFKPGDKILNPFDRRSQGWSPFSEIRRPYDFDKIARSIVADGQDANSQWHFYAQVLISQVMGDLMRQGQNTTVALIEALTIWPTDKLKDLVAGTPASTIFDKDAAKAMASVRFILSMFLKPFQYLQAGDFSLRHWLESGSGNIYLTWREDMSTSLAPLIACWVDVLCTASLSLPPDQHRRIWLMLDELPSLGKISNLEAALTKGRKHGLCCVAGIQSTAQLDRIFGRDAAVVLRSCFRNFVAFATAKVDPDSAETFSRSLGEEEIDRLVHTTSNGANGSGNSISTQRVLKRIVLPTQLNELADLSAYLALSGATPTVKIQLQAVKLPIVAAAMEE